MHTHLNSRFAPLLPFGNKHPCKNTHGNNRDCKTRCARRGAARHARSQVQLYSTSILFFFSPPLFLFHRAILAFHDASITNRQLAATGSSRSRNTARCDDKVDPGFAVRARLSSPVRVLRGSLAQLLNRRRLTGGEEGMQQNQTEVNIRAARASSPPLVPALCAEDK